MPAEESGIAILYLHALPLDGTMWNLQRRQVRVKSYAPTLYGFGDTVTEWAETALALVEEPKVVVVGCSIGGSCALELARLAPERVAALVLAGTKADVTPQPAFLAEAVGTILGKPSAAAWTRYWKPLISERSPAFAADTLRWIYDRQSAAHLARGTRAFHTRPARLDALKRYRGETVIVTGSEDVAPGPVVSRQQAEVSHNGSLKVVRGCGHYVPVEAPETFSHILLQVLARLAETRASRDRPAEAAAQS